LPQSARGRSGPGADDRAGRAATRLPAGDQIGGPLLEARGFIAADQPEQRHQARRRGQPPEPQQRACFHGFIR